MRIFQIYFQRVFNVLTVNLLLKDFLLYLRARERDSICCFAPQITAMANSQSWVRLKLGARSSIQLSSYPVWQRRWPCGRSSSAFPSALTGNWIRSGSTRTGTDSLRDGATTGSSLTLLHQSTSP